MRSWDFPSVKAHFVCADDALWPELASWNGINPLDPKVLARRTIDSRDCWIIRTYYELRLRGAKVTISARPRAGMMNIIDVYRLGKKARFHLNFLILTRADGHPSTLVNFFIVQNEYLSSLEQVPSSSIPHWPQPGLIPRSPSRGEMVRVLAFKGLPANLDARFKSEGFENALNALGVTLRTSPLRGQENWQEWADYSDCDLVLAARNLTEYDASNKPASKLVNAWFGEVPALLGPEPAFLTLRRSDLDFFIIRSTNDVLRAVRQLQEKPGLYRLMVENGRKRRLEFTEDMIAKRWAEVLSGAASTAFEEWQHRPWFEKVKFVANGLRSEAEARRVHRQRFLTGKRILEEDSDDAV
jgi:hypothetical protein